MRILVTNDDGVRAPGISALARAAAGDGHEVVVVAPLDDCSGAGAAVGAFYRRDGVEYEAVTIEGIEHVPAYGVDGPPALCVIFACVGGFGPRFDLLLSGVNHGANLGRAALHSGTIGAALTGAHFGLRALAVSIRYGPDPVPWTTASSLAAAVVPALAEAPPATVLNLNVPDVDVGQLRGVRRATLGRGGTIRSVRHDGPDPGALPPRPGGVLRLDLALPGAADDTAEPAEDASDAALVAAGYATLTPLTGVGEAGPTGAADAAVDAAQGALTRSPEAATEIGTEQKPDAASALGPETGAGIPS